ncbi:GntR family transcriptional regulator [Streptomyces sp. XM4011]|uniref:GntR family transcriptional regulator n=1 Tax=Streptomyces sp. XM4011 TaxID=2929780 RepID=UPI001FF94D83|nr:GntR family transcriptional regulator [Streptomyces sp. XM4011]MCK1813286.1 GntR family transcriptional regulator [Streptomyces sp. XM4011]
MNSASDEGTSERTALYRLYDDAEQLLYVGITSRPKERMRQHAGDKHWYREVSFREIEWFDSREEAGQAEVEAIRTERPLHNHQHLPSSVLALLPVAESPSLRPRLKQVDHDERPEAQRMAAELRALIMSGDISIGDRLPTTAECESRFKVSNVTVQRGLKKLKAEGFAVGQTGRGVFAASPTPASIEDTSRLTLQTMSEGEGPLPRSLRTALAIPEEQTATWEELVVRADGWPVRLVTIYRFPASEAVSAAVSHTEQITVRVPTGKELIALNLSEDLPIMRIMRVSSDAAGCPTEVQIIIEPGNICRREYTIDAPAEQ